MWHGYVTRKTQNSLRQHAFQIPQPVAPSTRKEEKQKSKKSTREVVRRNKGQVHPALHTTTQVQKSPATPTDGARWDVEE